MIGDWVRLVADKFPYKVNSVETIHPLPDVTLDDYGCVFEDEVEPIPLTEEILKANGWECSDGWFERNDVDFFIAKCVDKYKLCQVYHMRSFVTIAYVHELQHALRLCGLNELADTFKV